MDISSIRLREEQKKLFILIVEAHRNADPDRIHHGFALQGTASGISILMTPPPSPNEEVDFADFEDFNDYGLIRLKESRNRSGSFSITPFGHEYYEYLQVESGHKTEVVQKEISSYLSSDKFAARFPLAWDKWSKAFELQYETEADTSISQIGHLCREAVQEFAEALIAELRNADAPAGKQETVKRMKWLFEQMRGRYPEVRIELLDALIVYWGVIQDMVARQEHSGHKEGKPVTLEESRCLLFQTMNVMYEITRLIR